jgi:hypothetical protein
LLTSCEETLALVGKAAATSVNQEVTAVIQDAAKPGADFRIDRIACEEPGDTRTARARDRAVRVARPSPS